MAQASLRKKTRGFKLKAMLHPLFFHNQKFDENRVVVLSSQGQLDVVPTGVTIVSASAPGPSPPPRAAYYRDPPPGCSQVTTGFFAFGQETFGQETISGIVHRPIDMVNSGDKIRTKTFVKKKLGCSPCRNAQPPPPPPRSPPPSPWSRAAARDVQPALIGLQGLTTIC